VRLAQVVPPRASPRVQTLLANAGWSVEPAPADAGDDPTAAIRLARRGQTALFVPPRIVVARVVRRVLVLHGGSRAERSAVEVANETALASRAEIIMLHVPSAVPSTYAASLPVRIEDHAAYDWGEWRDEFLRRFSRYSPGLTVSLHVALGPPAEAFRGQIAQFRPDLVVTSGAVSANADRGHSLANLLEVARCPVLVVPRVGQTDKTRNGSRSDPRQGGALRSCQPKFLLD
jgi:hypothetical protein